MKYVKDGPPFTSEHGPYEYSKEIIEKVKERVKAKK